MGKESESEPCNLVSARLRRNSNVWSAFESPMFEIEIFPTKDVENIGTTLENGKGKETDLKKSNSGGNWKRYLGIFFALMSSVVFSLGTVVVKRIQSYHAFNLSTWRFLGVLIPNTLILCYYWGNGKSEIVKDIWPTAKPGAKRNLGILFVSARMVPNF